MAEPALVKNRRELTHKAIQLNPTFIVLKRRVRVPDGAGGYRLGPEQSLPAQTFRLYISSNRGSREIAQEGGQMQVNELGLLAEHDADVAKGDKFQFDDRNYEIVKLDKVRLLSHVVSIQCLLKEVV